MQGQAGARGKSIRPQSDFFLFISYQSNPSLLTPSFSTFFFLLSIFLLPVIVEGRSHIFDVVKVNMFGVKQTRLLVVEHPEPGSSVRNPSLT
jgi:hypothetical protein